MKGIVKMEKIKKTWVSVGEKENLIELLKRCENKQFVKFVKEHPMECFPPIYFQHFSWIKMRFDDLKYDFENDNDPLLNVKTYPEYYNEEEDLLDFGDFDLSRGCNVGEEPQINTNDQKSFIQKERQQSYIRNNHKVTPYEIIQEKQNNKNLDLVINNYHEIIPALKCLLWSLDNEPQTTKSLYFYIKINDNGNIRSFVKEDYEFLNPIIKDAPKNGFLELEKPSKDVFLYKNNTDTRQGYFYDGKLMSFSELVKTSGIPKSTLSDRLKRMTVQKAMDKQV
jgi:hypothetical protein